MGPAGPQRPHILISGLSISLTAFLTPQESAYHTVAVLLYSIASILEILATIYMQDGFTYEHYLENISAVVSAPSASPCSQLLLPADRGSEQKAALLCPGLG